MDRWTQEEGELKRVCSLASGDGRTRVGLELYAVGSDLLAVLTGQGPHIGAVSLAEPSSEGVERVQGLAAPPHKEQELTDLLARVIARASRRRAAVLAGIHLDGITREEIDAIRDNVRELARRLSIDLRPIEEEDA